MESQGLVRYYGTEDDNPITLLMRRMQIPLFCGIGAGIAIQAARGLLESPATFGKMAQCSLPACGIGFYYLAGTYITERIRGRDGPLNNLIGAYCTIPVIRRFLSLTATTTMMFFISLPLYAVVRGFKVSTYPLTLEQSGGYGAQMSSCDINLLLQKKPSEPFVQRESYNPFKFPSK